MAPDSFAHRLAQLDARLTAAATRASRDPAAITLIAVSKGHPPSLLQHAYEAGLRHFGENRVAELRDKQAALSLEPLHWHFVGPLQRRKARQLVGHATLIHSIDRLSLAEELSRRGEAAQTMVTGLLQVNASGEASKGGWPIRSAIERQQFLAEVEVLLTLPWLTLRGLMTMAPFYDDPEWTRPTFATTRATLDALQARFPTAHLDLLSMGMSNDFEIAIEEGATHVRVGTALFGDLSP